MSADALYFHHPASLEHDPRAYMPGHPDTPERILAIEQLLAQTGWLGWQRREAPAAEEAQLELIHSPTLVARIREMCLAGGGSIDPDTHVSDASYRAALHAAGGACALARTLLAGEAHVGFSGARPSGHHAEANRAMGFCLFNNVAIAAELAVHPQTVRYRLRRLRDLFGAGLEDPDRRFDLEIALRGRSAIRRSPALRR